MRKLSFDYNSHYLIIFVLYAQSIELVSISNILSVFAIVGGKRVHAVISLLNARHSDTLVVTICRKSTFQDLIQATPRGQYLGHIECNQAFA